MPREGEQGEKESRERYSDDVHNRESVQEVIEISSDSDVEEMAENGASGSTSDLVIIRDEDDSEAEAPGAGGGDAVYSMGRATSRDNNEQIMTNEEDTGDDIRTRRIRRHISPRERSVRRRLNSDDSEIQILHERPAQSQLRLRDPAANSSTGGQPGYFMQTIATPIGTFFVRSEDNSRHDRQSRLSPTFTNARRIQPRRTRNPPRRMPGMVNTDDYLLWQGIYQSLIDHPHYHSPHGSNEIEGSIMARIERDNDRTVDQKLQREIIYNRKELNAKKKIIETELPGYTNDLNPQVDVCCELCGILLGEGIPNDFNANPAYNDNFDQYSKEYGVRAPWFCMKECLIADRDLSKRVFASKCGHVYCGRCVRNIGNRIGRRKKVKQPWNIDNPLVTSPKSCVSESCDKPFRGKKPFIELFF